MIYYYLNSIIMQKKKCIMLKNFFMLCKKIINYDIANCNFIT